MLIHGSRLIGCPILSLHVGGKIAEVTDVIIDPNDLKLIGLRVEGPALDEEMGDILPIERVREFSQLGMVIDSFDDLAGEGEVVKISNILKLNFELTGLKVLTKKKEKLGKVSDYVLNSASWEVYQLIVQRPVMKALIDPELTVSRSHIVEVNDYEVIVKAEKETPKAKAQFSSPADFTPNFINPFRNPDFSHETSRRRP